MLVSGAVALGSATEGLAQHRADHGNGPLHGCAEICPGEETMCTVGFQWVDFEFEDAWRMWSAWYEVQLPGGVTRRVPLAGTLPIVSITGNAVCTTAGALTCETPPCDFPCVVGKAGAIYGGLLGRNGNGKVGFDDLSVSGYTIQLGDPSPLTSFGYIDVEDLCNQGDCQPERFDSFTPASTKWCDPRIGGQKCVTDVCDSSSGAAICSHAPIPGCCKTDEQCVDAGTKCHPGVCDQIQNICVPSGVKEPGCCTSDAQCGGSGTKCFPEGCDLDGSRPETNFTPNKCYTTDVKRPGCCESDAQCGDWGTKCGPGLCDLDGSITGEPNRCYTGDKRRDCCESDAQCVDAGTKCAPGMCDLDGRITGVPNTCYTSDKRPDCCESDAQCPDWETKCGPGLCDLDGSIVGVPNRCYTGPKRTDCCTSDDQCGECAVCDLVANTCSSVCEDPAFECPADTVCDPAAPGCCSSLACRVTGGGVDTTSKRPSPGRLKKYAPPSGEHTHGRGVNRYTMGGQAGAPTASQPQPYGEWTHHNQRGPSGRFVFHAGTASAPPPTEIDLIECSDPGWCVQAREAPAKQIDFEGIGTFKNMDHKAESSFLDAAPGEQFIAGETFHWFSVHIEDLGEPGRGGRMEPPSDICPVEGSAGAVADCDCPDFYTITIHATDDPSSAVVYNVFGYITGGNLQIHPPIVRGGGR